MTFAPQQFPLAFGPPATCHRGMSRRALLLSVVAAVLLLGALAELLWLRAPSAIRPKNVAMIRDGMTRAEVWEAPPTEQDVERFASYAPVPIVPGWGAGGRAA